MNGHKSVSQYDWTSSEGTAVYRISILDNGRVNYYKQGQDEFGTTYWYRIDDFDVDYVAMKLVRVVNLLAAACEPTPSMVVDSSIPNAKLHRLTRVTLARPVYRLPKGTVHAVFEGVPGQLGIDRPRLGMRYISPDMGSVTDGDLIEFQSEPTFPICALIEEIE